MAEESSPFISRQRKGQGDNARYDIYQPGGGSADGAEVSVNAILGQGLLCLLVVTLAGVSAYVVGNFFVGMAGAIPSVDKLACSRESDGYAAPKYHPSTHQPSDYWKACYFAYECCTSISAHCLNADAKQYGKDYNPYASCTGCMSEYAHQSLTVECEVDIESDRRTSQDVIDDEDCWEEAEDVDQKNFANECQITPDWCEKECGGDNDFQGKHILCKYCIGRATGSGSKPTTPAKFPKGSPAHPHGTKTGGHRR